MSLHYLNGIISEQQTIKAINKNAFKKGVQQLNKPEFNTPFTMANYDVNDILLYPTTTKKEKAAVNGWLEDAFNNITNTVQTAATNVASTLSTGVQNVVSTTTQAVQNVVSTVQQAGATALQNVQTTLQSGLQNLSLPTLSIQKLNDIWSKLQVTVGTYGKKIALAPLRQAFITAVSFNANNLANYMLQGWQKDKNKISNWWTDLGGDINVLKQAIAKGSKTAISGNAIGEVNVEQVLKVVAVALPLIAAVIGILKSLGVGVKKEDSDAISRVQPETPPTVTATSTQTETVPTDTFTSSLTDNKTMLYVGIGGALLIGGYLFLKRK